MKRKYAGILSRGKPAQVCYSLWRSYLVKLAERRAARLAAREARLLARLAEKEAEGVGKRVAKRWAKKIPWVGALITAYLWRQDVQAKGFGPGTANSILDAVPFLGIAKGVTEFARGEDFIPDKDEGGNGPLPGDEQDPYPGYELQRQLEAQVREFNRQLDQQLGLDAAQPAGAGCRVVSRGWRAFTFPPDR